MSSSSDNAGRVQKALLDLTRLILRKDAVPDDLIAGLKRHLRPADAESVSDFHYNALKHRLRSSLLTQSINGNRKDDGPVLVSKMEKELDRLRRGGFKNLTSFLALIEPLSFRQSRSSSFLVSSSTAKDMVTDEDEKWREAGRVVVEGGGSNPRGSARAAHGVPAEKPSAQLTWISPAVELKLIKDLLFVFQVCLPPHTLVE